MPPAERLSNWGLGARNLGYEAVVVWWRGRNRFQVIFIFESDDISWFVVFRFLILFIFL